MLNRAGHHVANPKIEGGTWLEGSDRIRSVTVKPKPSNPEDLVGGMLLVEGLEQPYSFDPARWGEGFDSTRHMLKTLNSHMKERYWLCRGILEIWICTLLGVLTEIAGQVAAGLVGQWQHHGVARSVSQKEIACSHEV